MVRTNWTTLQKSALFRPLPTTLAQTAAPLTEPFVNIACDLIEQQAQAYAKSFSHVVGFAGLIGFLWYLRAYPAWAELRRRKP